MSSADDIKAATAEQVAAANPLASGPCGIKVPSASSTIYAFVTLMTKGPHLDLQPIGGVDSDQVWRPSSGVWRIDQRAYAGEGKPSLCRLLGDGLDAIFGTNDMHSQLQTVMAYEPKEMLDHTGAGLLFAKEQHDWQEGLKKQIMALKDSLKTDAKRILTSKDFREFSAKVGLPELIPKFKALHVDAKDLEKAVKGLSKLVVGKLGMNAGDELFGVVKQVRAVPGVDQFAKDLDSLVKLEREMAEGYFVMSAPDLQGVLDTGPRVIVGSQIVAPPEPPKPHVLGFRKLMFEGPATTAYALVVCVHQEAMQRYANLFSNVSRASLPPHFEILKNPPTLFEARSLERAFKAVKEAAPSDGAANRRGLDKQLLCKVESVWHRTLAMAHKHLFKDENKGSLLGRFPKPCNPELMLQEQ